MDEMKRAFRFAAAAAAAICLFSQSAQASVKAGDASASTDTEKKVSPSRETKLITAPVALDLSRETSLISASITPSRPDATVLLLATVALSHTGGPGDKTVALKLLRDSVPIEGTYTVRIGVTSRAVSDVPVTLHAMDAPKDGSHTYTVSAKTNGSGVQATLRRLTLIELP